MRYKYFIVCLLIISLQGQFIEAQPRRTILFNSDWKFYNGEILKAEQVLFDDAGWRKLDLPHDWSIEGPFDEQWASATAYLPAGIGWYRKTFELAREIRSKNIFLYFDGVYKNSEVWVNGHYLGKRPNGFIPFEYEITPFLNKTGKNIVAVKVDHSQFADSRWCTGSGIYRNVYLTATEPVHIAQWGVFFPTSQLSSKEATANIMVSVVNQTLTEKRVVVDAQLMDANGKKLARAQQQVNVGTNNKVEAKLSFKVNQPSLWSPEHPALYKLVVELRQNRKIIDDFSEHVGFRSLQFNKDKGFLLNGQRW